MKASLEASVVCLREQASLPSRRQSLTPNARQIQRNLSASLPSNGSLNAGVSRSPWLCAKPREERSLATCEATHSTNSGPAKAPQRRHLSSSTALYITEHTFTAAHFFTKPSRLEFRISRECVRQLPSKLKSKVVQS